MRIQKQWESESEDRDYIAITINARDERAKVILEAVDEQIRKFDDPKMEELT